ncbi:TetR/AcrR family transcriptional regulator [Lentzea sp. E54]|uniref:TetR/AcrR family transcriptional regulator n=1 Tax=Lentzea xerophila TaxID=3435883 RepID=UPI003DA3CD50
MALTAKGRATRQRIIEGAAAYLRGDDPAGVTLDDIRAITGTSKGQIFHYFPDGKEELFLAVARHEAERVLDDQQPHLGALTSWAAWERWRDSVVARYRAQGRHCPLGALMGQLGSTPGAHEVVSALLGQWQFHLRQGVSEMQRSGLVRGNLDPERVSAAFIAGVQGGVLVLMSTGSVVHLEAAMDTLIDHLRG